MKKFLTTIVALAAFGLVACNNNQPAPQPEPEPEEKCTEHEDGYVGYFLTGPNCIQVNGVKASENKGKEWDFGGDSFELKPIELAKVKDISEDVWTKLSAKTADEVKGIYSLSGVTMGLTKEGWGQNFKKGDKIYNANASYVAKIIETKYSGEDDAWSTQTWIPDPSKAHVEDLGNFWTPTFQEQADEDGFAWNQNPVVTDGAGVYTVVFAVYGGGASLERCNYGVAFVKTQELPVKYEELQPWKGEHSYKLIGTINGWDDSAQPEMVLQEDGTYQSEVTLATTDEIKVRADGAVTEWKYSWGMAAVKDEASLALVEGSDNIKVKEAGTYVITLKLGAFAHQMEILVAKKVAAA